MNTPDISISMSATARWKKKVMRTSDSKFSPSNEKILRSLISTQDASRFLNTSFTPGITTPKISTNEDLKEVSLQLVQLKKKHDLNKNKNFLYQNLLDRDSKFIEKSRHIELKTLSLAETLKQKLETLENQTQEIVKKQEEALAARKVYKHIFNRMKITQIKFDEQDLSLNFNLKFSDQLLNDEATKSRRAKENKIRTKSALSSLENYISREKQEKIAKLRVAENDANEKLKSSKNREFRMKHQIEIAEAAADDDRNMRAMQTREGLMLHRLTHYLLEIKLKKSMQKFAIIEESFRKIKNTYGDIEPADMIEKILTKEAAFTDLLSSINYNKSKISAQTEKNSELEEKIEHLENIKMQHIDPNIFWKNELGKLTKEYAVDSEKLLKIRILFEKIQLWIGRNLKKIGIKDSEKCEKIKDNFFKIKEFIRNNFAENKRNRLVMNKSFVDSLKVEEVLKLYVPEEEKRRRTISMSYGFGELNLMKELSLVEDEDQNKKKFSSTRS